MSLAPKLAFRNLFHDRLRLIATVIGLLSYGDCDARIPSRVISHVQGNERRYG